MEKLNSVLTVWKVTGIDDDVKTSRGTAKKAYLESTSNPNKTASVLHYLYRGHSLPYKDKATGQIRYGNNFTFEIGMKIVGVKSELADRLKYFALTYEQDVFIEFLKTQGYFKGFDISKYKTGNDVIEQLNNDAIYDGCEIIVEDKHNNRKDRYKHEYARDRMFMDGKRR